MTEARREAVGRKLSQAMALGTTAVVNVRCTTSQVANSAAGTLRLRKGRGGRPAGRPRRALQGDRRLGQLTRIRRDAPDHALALLGGSGT